MNKPTEKIKLMEESIICKNNSNKIKDNKISFPREKSFINISIKMYTVPSFWQCYGNLKSCFEI